MSGFLLQKALLALVRGRGFEPPRLAALDPKSAGGLSGSCCPIPKWLRMYSFRKVTFPPCVAESRGFSSGLQQNCCQILRRVSPLRRSTNASQRARTSSRQGRYHTKPHTLMPVWTRLRACRNTKPKVTGQQRTVNSYCTQTPWTSARSSNGLLAPVFPRCW